MFGTRRSIPMQVGPMEIYVTCPAITPTAGAELWDGPASRFDSGTYSWVAAGGNTIANDTNSLKITRVDNNNGAGVAFSNAADLSSDLTIGTWYQCQMTARVNAGSTVTPQIDGGVAYPFVSLSSVAPVTVNMAFRATSATANTVGILAMGAGEIAWVDNLSLKPLIFSSLICHAGDHPKNGTYTCTPTRANPNSAIGMLIEYKDENNYVMAVLYGNTAYLFSCIAGVHVRKTYGDIAYILGGMLKVVVNGTTHSLYYRGVKVGTNQTIDTSTMGLGVYGFNTIAGDSVGLITTTKNTVVEIPPAQTGSVIFTFDDGGPTFYANAYPLLVSKNIKGTSYVITDKLDTVEAYTTAQAQEMYAAGVDIANHSKSHVDFTTLTSAQVQANVLAAKAVLDAAGMTRASGHVAYPFGWYNATTKAAMAAAGMVSARSTDLGYANLMETHEGGGIYAVSIYPYIMRTTALATAQAVVDAVKANNHLAIFLFHSIVAVPATSYDWATADLSSLMDYVNAQGVRSLTISQWASLYRAVY